MVCSTLHAHVQTVLPSGHLTLRQRSPFDRPDESIMCIVSIWGSSVQLQRHRTHSTGVPRYHLYIRTPETRAAFGLRVRHHRMFQIWSRERRKRRCQQVDIMSVIDIVCGCEVVFTANPCRVANHFDPLPPSLSLSVSSAGITPLILLSFTL